VVVGVASRERNPKNAPTAIMAPAIRIDVEVESRCSAIVRVLETARAHRAMR
jgi:hypothetical protein